MEQNKIRIKIYRMITLFTESKKLFSNILHKKAVYCVIINEINFLLGGYNAITRR